LDYFQFGIGGTNVRVPYYGSPVSYWTGAEPIRVYGSDLEAGFAIFQNLLPLRCHLAWDLPEQHPVRFWKLAFPDHLGRTLWISAATFDSGEN
jgi:hypothetical protein